MGAGELAKEMCWQLDIFRTSQKHVAFVFGIDACNEDTCDHS